MRLNNPFAELTTLEHYINELFDDAFNSIYQGRTIPLRRKSAVDVMENDNEYLVRIDLPGYSKENIDITSHESSVEIAANRTADDERELYQLRERSFGELRRAVEFSTRIDAEKMTAEYVNGVLTIHCPKAVDAQPRQIPVLGEQS
ncbi:Hsp20/alpha crystallin family protein [bacterium]|nr:Hsp20/alpha crystallin family protein [bacterium]